MIVSVIKIKIDIPWIQSLKEKRTEVKSLLARLRNKFNVSVLEFDTQNIHKTVSIAVIYGVDTVKQSDKYYNTIVNFIDNSTEGEVSILERYTL